MWERTLYKTVQTQFKIHELIYTVEYSLYIMKLHTKYTVSE